MPRTRGLFLTLFLLLALSPTSLALGPDGLKILQDSYPDVKFDFTYDIHVKDWEIKMTVPSVPKAAGGDTEGNRSYTFYWCGGSMLPLEEIPNREMYWSILYPYPKVLADPAGFTDEQVEQIKNFSSSDNRRNGAGTPMFFFDALYCSDSRAHLESCLKKISFLGFTCTVHKRIVDPLKKVNDEIMALAKTDNETKSFVNSLTSAEAYFWRIIAGTKRKSFHSLGIAVDIRPKRLNGKAIFWSWTKDKEPENWMLTPLAKRWIPPQKVLDIFERNGFIWGGKWIIFDNMHFEYHPELIEFNGIIQNQESAETNTGVSTTQN